MEQKGSISFPKKSNFVKVKIVIEFYREIFFKTQFMPLVPLCTPWKHHKYLVFWYFQGVIEKNQKEQ